jgi:hypothetical protein
MILFVFVVAREVCGSNGLFGLLKQVDVARREARKLSTSRRDVAFWRAHQIQDRFVEIFRGRVPGGPHHRLPR